MSGEMSCAPIVLFVYNRPQHTRKTIEALRTNRLADQSELIVYSDGAKGEADIHQVTEVRRLVRSISGFKKVTVIESENNRGLAASIIRGVTDVVNQYGRVIVLEDDIVTSPYFLTFMNGALNRYQHESRVMHIAGWGYPIDANGLGDASFIRVMNCWGWATWADRWQYFDKSPQALVDLFTPEMIERFDVGVRSSPFWGQVLANISGRLDTWAIFWYATIFLRDGLCLSPTVSYVRNIGHDGSGVNCGSDFAYGGNSFEGKENVCFPDVISESELAVARIRRDYLKQDSFMGKCVRAIKKRLLRWLGE